jgi:SAM-dependent methyltransferase
MSTWNERQDVPRGADYDAAWTKMAAAGEPIHGEVDLILDVAGEQALGPSPAMLDAGCGTGRVAIELAARGVDVVGIDLDEAMLAEARSKAPDLRWIHGDLTDFDLDTTFDLVVLAGNVIVFVTPGSEGAVLANIAHHLRPGGLLVAGYRTDERRLAFADFDRHAEAAGLDLVHRWSSWDRAPFDDGDYAVTVHRRR